jgi:Zn finger protein HypA/HybF involved in hydrogenase expression
MVKNKFNDSEGYNESDNKDTIQKLKAANRRLVKENKKLKQEMQNLEAAFSRTEHLLKNSVKGKSLASIMKSLVEDGTLPENYDMPEEFIEEIIPTHKCPKCGNKDFKVITSDKSTLTVCNICNHRALDKEIVEEFDISPVENVK